MKDMCMSEIEIAGKFRRADDKNEMLQILAELNACGTAEMKEYLLAHGFTDDELRPKRGRRKRMDKDTAVIEVHAKAEDIPPIEPINSVAQLMEIPELTEEEQARADRADAIPWPVRMVVAKRIDELTAQVMELERERDILCEYLAGR